MSRRLFVWLIASLAIHTGLTAVGLAALRGVAPPALFVDLVHDLLGADAPLASAGRAGGAAVSAAAGGGQSPNATRRARPEHPTASPSTPRPPSSPPRDVRPAPEPSPAPERPPLMAVEPTRPAPEPAVALPLPVLEIAPTAPPASGPAAGAAREGVVGTSTPATGPASASPGTPGRDPGGRAGGSGDGSGSGAGVGAHEGGALVLAVPGAGGDGAGEYGTYLALLRRRIGEVLSYPPSARRRGLAGTVQIELEIQVTGAISRVAVVASSSHRLLDDAAVEAVHGLGRLPFPAGVPPRHLRVRLPVVFDLR